MEKCTPRAAYAGFRSGSYKWHLSTQCFKQSGQHMRDAVGEEERAAMRAELPGAALHILGRAVQSRPLNPSTATNTQALWISPVFRSDHSVGSLA